MADAGSPYLYVYARGADDWSGGREPIATLRQMDDDTFLRGRYNTQEGGPKGIDVDRSGRILAVTSEHEPLAFYDMAAIVTDDSAGTLSPVEPGVSFDEAGRELLLGAVVRNDDLVSRIDGLHAEIARLHEAVADSTTAVEIVRRELGARESAVARLEAKVAELSTDLAACRSTALRHVDMVADRQRRVVDLEGSTSWRATAPLRWANGMRQRFSAPHAPPNVDVDADREV